MIHREIKLISFETDGRIMMNDLDIDGDIADNVLKGDGGTSSNDLFDEIYGF